MRYANQLQQVLVAGVVLVIALSGGGIACASQLDEWSWELPPTGGEEATTTRSIAEELNEGMQLLEEQIAKEEAALATATTARERQLTTDHIRVLKQEHNSLVNILHQLVGPIFDARTAAREQQSELRYEREQKILEQDQRFPAQ